MGGIALATCLSVVDIRTLFGLDVLLLPNVVLTESPSNSCG